jgi:hypothetical protein
MRYQRLVSTHIGEWRFHILLLTLPRQLDSHSPTLLHYFYWLPYTSLSGRRSLHLVNHELQEMEAYMSKDSALQSHLRGEQQSFVQAACLLSPSIRDRAASFSKLLVHYVNVNHIYES